VVTNLKLNPSHARSDRPGWPALLALTLAVSAAHLWLMAAAPLSLGLGASRPLNATAPLTTRTITPEPPSTAATPRAPAAAGPEPAPPRTKGLSIAALDEAGAEVTQSEPTVERPNEPVPIPAEPGPDPATASETAPSPSAAASAPTSSAEAPAELLTRSEGAGSASPQATASTAVPAAVAAPASTSSDRRLALAVPGSVRLNYELNGRSRGFDYSASARLDWQHDGQRYQARLVISSFPLPSRSQSSDGEIGLDGLSPRRFSDRSRGEVAVHFQPELSRITFSASGTPAIWQPGAQDRLSLSLQLAAMIAGEPAHFTPGTKVTILTAGTRSAEPWEFTVMDTETLNLPVGNQAALRLRREPRHPYDQTVELWFAPALGHLPVRIRLSQGNGDLVDQRLASMERP
jgi:Protein of unknown function (DUF3108)